MNVQTYHTADSHAAIIAYTEAHVLPFHPHELWIFGVDIKVVGFKVVFVTEVGAIAVAERVDKAIVARCCFALFYLHIPCGEEAFVNSREHVVTECARAQLFPSVLFFACAD